MAHEIDGHEAYRDDPEYTAPEMQPGMGVDILPDPDMQWNVVTGTGMTGGVAGGALAGEALVTDVDQERADMTPRRGGEV